MPCLDLAHALEDLLGREQVDAAELVVVAPVAPGRPVRTLLSSASPRLPPRCSNLYRSVHVRGRSEPAREEVADDRAPGLRRLGRRAHPRADRPVHHPPPEAPARPRRSGRRTSRSSPSSRAARRIFRRLHTPGFEGWTISRYRQTGGRTPEGDPEIILEDMAFDGVDVAVMHPNLSLFGLYSDDHELSMAHARVYNDYIVERFAPVLRPHRAHRARSDHRHRRRGRRDRARRRGRVPRDPAARHPADALLLA